ncbi:MAG TPA: LptF/LptG family permease [Anaeromyxobacteraceae bacterium]|nr:LptF/LptG family permease [Anaeromyxobacteraceae bacterium]
MPLLDRYLAREILLPFGAGLVFLTQILLATQILAQADILFGSGVAAWDVVRVVLLLTPHFLGFILPVAFLLGAVVGVARLAEDREIIAVGAAGLSPIRLVRVPLLLGALVSALALWLALEVEPASLRSARLLLNEIIKKNVTSDVKAGTFYDDIPGYTLYAEGVKGARWRNVLISDRSDPDAAILALARSGRFEPAPAGEAMRLVLERGEIHREEGASEEYALAAFERATLDVGVHQTLSDRNRLAGASREFTTRELLANARDAPDRAQRLHWLGYFHKKLSQGLAMIPFALLAVPLGAVRRGGRSFGVGATLAVVLAQYLLLRGGEVLAQHGTLPPALALQLPTIVLSLAGAAAVALLARRGVGAVR